MAKLTRKHQKIFAGNANNNGVFGSLQAGQKQLSNDVETIQSLPAYEEGWNSATISSELLPPLEEFQGVQYANSYQLGYLLQEGVPEWDSNTEYYIGSWVKAAGTGNSLTLYESVADNNINHHVTDEDYWKEIDFGGSNLPMFMPFVADHLLNNISFLRADTFSWQPASIYGGAYDTLLTEYMSPESQEKTDTIGSLTVTYKLTPSLYKICALDQLQTIQQLIQERGVAWYYVLDVTNTQFKLPCIINPKPYIGNEDIPVVGNGMTLGIMYNDINSRGYAGWTGSSNAQYNTSSETYGTMLDNTAGHGTLNVAGKKIGLTTDATKSGIVAKLSAQEGSSSQNYLYFYVGKYAATAIQQTAGLNTELFNDKADLDLSNISSATRDLLVECSFPNLAGEVIIGSSPSSFPYTTLSAGWLKVDLKSVGYCHLSWSGKEFYTGSAGNNYGSNMFPISKGVSVSHVGGSGTWVVSFEPCKGF